MERLKSLKNFFLVIVLLILAGFVSAFLGGAISVLGGNVELVGLSSITFDPLLTIAYIVLYYYLSKFYEVAGRAAYWLFIFTVLLSFTVNFIQGAILLILFFAGLKRLKVIGASPII